MQGQGFVFAVRNQDGNCPWCVVEHVTVINNEIADVATPISILARDTNCEPPVGCRASGVMSNILIAGNRFTRMDPVVWGPGARGATYEVLAGPDRLTLENNEVIDGLNVHSMIFFGVSQYPATNLVV